MDTRRYMMNEEKELEYFKRFTDTYFSFPSDQKGLREAACLKIQFSECLLPPEDEDMVFGKYDYLCVGFGMQEAGMGYFLNQTKFDELVEKCPEQKELLFEIYRKWLPETGRQQLIEQTPAYILDVIPNDNFKNESNVAFWLCRMSSTHLDFDKLMLLGIPGLRKEVQNHLNGCCEDSAIKFYQEELNLLDMFCEVAEVCAQKSELSGAKYGNQISENLRNITKRKPESFWEAVQLMYLYAVMSGTYNYGRIDEYLGDFLANDLAKHKLTYDKARDILVSLWKLFIQRETTWNGRVIIGGKGRRNEKEANQLALLTIEVASIVKDVLPQLSLRFYQGQNPALMDKALEVIGQGCVYPMLYNDDVNIPSVCKAFSVSEHEAEQYLPFGCGEYIFSHRSVGTPSDIINLLKALEITLFNGYDYISQTPRGLKTGEFCNFKDFESFFRAYCRQVEYFTELNARQQKIEYETAAKHSPFLMASLLYDDCIQKGRPIYNGGVHYIGGTFETYGNTNTSDSLTAIKKLIFEEKVLSPKTLLDMLKANFEGYETERKLLLSAPKYGNDDAEADTMAARVHEHICKITQSKAKEVGLDSYLVVVINNSANTDLGHYTMASADGRMAYEPLANANNPSGGSDKSGLTALLNSLVKMRTDIHAGSVQNIKFSKEMFQEHFGETKAALEVYFENGGAQIMINVLGRDDLENAQKEPEKYQNLIVRVGGFCARFVELSKDVQKEIISRTMY